MEAFAELYRRHHPSVLNFARSRLHHEADAEDVTAEVFARALAAIGRYRERGVPIVSWLLQIAANVIVDQQRRRRRWRLEDVDELSEVLATASHHEDQVAARDLVRRLALAAGPLPAAHRMALELRFGEGLSSEETGLRLGRSTGAVKLLQHRGLSRLRKAAAALDLAS